MCPDSTSRHLYAWRSHTRAVLSSEHDTRIPPLAVIAAPVTAPVCPDNCITLHHKATARSALPLISGGAR